MRLPLSIPLDARDGLADQDGRMVNMVVEQYEDRSIVETRPGLSELSIENGTADGVVCFNGQLVSLFGATFDFFKLDSPEWDSGTTYPFQGTVWYLGDFYFSTFDNNTGNTPVGIGWSTTRPTTPEWNPDETYSIGDEVSVSGVPHFSYLDGNIGNSPAGSPLAWRTVAPNSSKTITDIVLSVWGGNNSSNTATYNFRISGVIVGSGSGTYNATSPGGGAPAVVTVSNWPTTNGPTGSGHDIGLSFANPSAGHRLFSGTTTWSGTPPMLNFPWAPSQSGGAWYAI